MRSLVIVMLILGAGLGLLGRELFQIRTRGQQQKLLVDRLRANGATVHERDKASLTLVESLANWLEGKDSISVVTHVSLGLGQIHDDDLAHTAKLGGLTSLVDRGRHFSDKSLGQLATNPTLTRVELDGWHGTESGAIALLSGNAPISELTLRGISVGNAFVEHASKSPHLEQLSFEGQSVTSEAIGQLRKSPTLLTLQIDYGKNLGKGLEKLADHPTLQNLALREYEFGTGDLEAIAKLDLLQGLMVQSERLPRGILRSVGDMERLQRLALAGEIEEDEECRPFRSPNLTTIGIDGLKSPGSPIAASLLQSRSLQTVFLPRIAFSDAVLEKLTANKQLRTLGIASGPSPEAISRFQRALPKCTVTLIHPDRRASIYHAGGRFELRQPPPVVEKQRPGSDNVGQAPVATKN
jgi:hypothetical protein